jgi:hypothetical protein
VVRRTSLDTPVGHAWEERCVVAFPAPLPFAVWEMGDDPNRPDEPVYVDPPDGEEE